MIFTDRSRYKTYFSCPFERFLNYHIYGTGIELAATSIPLATGSHAHKAIEIILNKVKATDDLPTSTDVREAIEKVTEDYYTEIADGGFLNQIDTSRAEYIVNEQTTLISGLVWSWASYILPAFLEDFQVLHVEQEMEKIIHCGCGLQGIGTVKDHVAKNCDGVCVMTRPDVVARKRISNSINYVELKTGSRIDAGTFDGDVQFAFGAAGIEGFVGEPLAESYVHGLIKGYRKKAYNSETRDYSGDKVQSSSLCYCYELPGSPPLAKQDIKFKWGKGVTKAYKKKPVWEIEFQGRPPEIPPVEHYISLMSDEELESHVSVFGPFPYPKLQVEQTLEDIKWLETANDIIFDEANISVAENGFAHPDTQQYLHRTVPKSWNCKRFDTICSYYPICMQQAGWEDPMEYMKFQPRTPNHPIEFKV